MVLLLIVGPVASGGDYVSADPQVSADGTVRLELAIVAAVLLAARRSGPR